MKLKFKNENLLKEDHVILKTLGISDERAMELANSLGNNACKTPDLFENLPRILKECNSIEEYSYACIALGGWLYYKE